MNCWVIAGYAETLPERSIEAWHAYARGTLDAEGVYVNVARVGGSKRLYDLPHQEAQMLERLSGGNSLSLYAHSKPYSQLVFGWDGCAIFSRSPGYAAIAALEARVTWSYGGLGRLLRQLWDRFGLQYGIAYSRDSTKGPELYAVGLASGLGYDEEGEREALAISRWGMEGVSGVAYRSGKLRDVYLWNALNPSQLSFPLRGATLEAWIHGSDSRGTLEPLARGGALWQVPPENLAAVRKALFAAGALLA